MNRVLFSTLAIVSTACSSTKAPDVVPVEKQYACQGFAIMAEELAEHRDAGLDDEQAYYAYVDEHQPPEGLRIHLAFMSKAIYDNRDLEKETFHHLYRYACLASMKGVSFNVGIPYLTKSARECEDSNKRKSMISGCIQMAYTQLLQEAPNLND